MLLDLDHDWTAPHSGTVRTDCYCFNSVAPRPRSHPDGRRVRSIPAADDLIAHEKFDARGRTTRLGGKIDLCALPHDGIGRGLKQAHRDRALVHVNSHSHLLLGVTG